jgi:hypothetical protein
MVLHWPELFRQFFILFSLFENWCIMGVFSLRPSCFVLVGLAFIMSTVVCVSAIDTGTIIVKSGDSFTIPAWYLANAIKISSDFNAAKPGFGAYNEASIGMVDNTATGTTTLVWSSTIYGDGWGSNSGTTKRVGSDYTVLTPGSYVYSADLHQTSPSDQITPLSATLQYTLYHNTAAAPKTGSDLQDSGARFSSLSGQVEVRPDNDPNAWDFAKMNTVLHVDDHVKTSEDSTAIIGFGDLSTFLLKPESEIVISTPPSHDSKIGLVAGHIWVNIKKMMKDGTMEVDMEQAAGGVKGTVFVAESDGKSSTFRGIIHDVAVTNKATGQTVTVGPGQMVTATANGMGPITTYNVTAEALAYGVDPNHLDQDPAITTAGASHGFDLIGMIAGIFGIHVNPSTGTRASVPETTIPATGTPVVTVSPTPVRSSDVTGSTLRSTWTPTATTQPATTRVRDSDVIGSTLRSTWTPAATPQPTATLTPPAPFDLGSVWTVKEHGDMGNYDGTWVREKGTNTFDASWSGGSIRDTVIVTSVAGKTITLHRRGNNGDYTGTFSADGKSISGKGSWYDSGETWTVSIV